MTLQEALQLARGVKQRGDNYSALCPAHDDQKQSLSFTEGDDGKLLMKCFAGCEFDDIIAGLRDGYSRAFPQTPSAPKPDEKIVAIYDYQNEKGEVLYSVHRTNLKNFYQRQPDGSPIGDTQRLLYHLPRLVKSQTVFFVEGEKDVHTLEALGFAATTVSGGANKSNWQPHFAGWFKSKKVVLLPDNDKPGKDFMTAIGNHLLQVTDAVKIIDLPGSGEKWDVTDWLEAGHTKEELVSLVRTTEPYLPSTSSEPIWNTTLQLEKPKPISWVVEKLIPREGTTVIAGKEGTYKTYLAMEMMYARGRKYLDTYDALPGRCLFIDGENGVSRMHRRVHELGHSGEQEKLFAFWFVPGRKLDQRLARDIIAKCKQLQCDTVLFDPYVQFMGGDEDKSGDTATFYRMLTLLHEQGLSAVLIHHVRKRGIEAATNQAPTSDDLRGSSALAAHASSIIQHQKVDGGVKIYQTKLRDAEQLDPFMVNVQAASDGPRFSYGGMATPSAFDELEEAAQTILGLLQVEPMHRGVILHTMKESGFKERTTIRALATLYEEGTIQKRKDGNAALYFMPKDTQSTLVADVQEVFGEPAVPGQPYKS